MDTKIFSANFRFMNQEFVKLDCVDDHNYTCWAHKANFMLVMLKLGFVYRPCIFPILIDLSLEAG